MEKEEIISNKKNTFYNYVYFIENHEKKEYFKIYLSRKCIVASDLELVQTIENTFEYEINIYRFKIYPDKVLKTFKNPEKCEIKINLRDRNNNKFHTIITNLQMLKDNFLYDTKFEDPSILFKRNSPKSLNLTHIGQFNYYINYIRNELKCNKDTKENVSLISSTQKMLEEKEQKFEFSTYLIIFLECSAIENIQYHLDLFNPEKILQIGDLNNEKLNEIKNKFNLLESMPLSALCNINFDKIEIYKNKLFILIFYFNYNFDKERIQEMLNNKKINKYIYIGLLAFQQLFNGLILSKDHIQNIINFSDDFYELKKALKYCKNVLELLEIINGNFKKFKDFYNNELNKNKDIEKSKDLFIDFEKYVIQNKDDNIKEIVCQIQILYKVMLENDRKIFIIFSPSFFEKYIDLYYLNNLDNLIYINFLISNAKLYQKSFEIQRNINLCIHDTGLLFYRDNKFTNIDILEFIQNDRSYYNPKSNYIKDPKSLDIFDKYNFSLNDKLIESKIRQINWFDIFGEEYLKFVSKVSNLINDLNQFHNLMIFLNIKDVRIPRDYYQNFFQILQNKYINLYKETYNKGEYPHFISDSADLIYYSDQNSEIEFFLSCQVQNILQKDLVYEIYMKLLSKYNKFSERCENIIVYFVLNENNITKKESNLLLYLLERCENSKMQIFTHFKNYNIGKDEIFNFDETDNIKLIKGLIYNGMFSKDNSLITEYYENNQKILDEIKEKIDKYEIIYNNIEHFFNDKSSEVIFNKRLLIIYNLDSKQANEKSKLISERFHYNKNIINDLETLIEDSKFFFKNSNNIDIEKVEQIIKSIELNNLNFCQNNQEIDAYSTQIEEAKERLYKRKSLIYCEIYKSKRELYPNDDYKCIKESNLKIDEFMPFLTYHEINNKNEELETIFKAIKLNKELINNEVYNLMMIFKYNDNNSKKRITNSILSLYYKEKIIKLLLSIKNIIEITKVKKRYFYGLINTMLKNLKENNLVSNIQFCINILNIYKIDIFKDNDNFINLFIRLYDFPEIIESILGNKIENIDKRSNIIKSNNIYDIFVKIFKFIKIFENKEEISHIDDKTLIEGIIEKVNQNNELNSSEINYDCMVGEIDNFIKCQIKI